MALEQMYAYLEGKPQSELGPTTEIGPDFFPLLESSELKEEHELISEMIEKLPRLHASTDFEKTEAYKKMAYCDKQARTRYCMAMLERIAAHDAGIKQKYKDRPNVDSFFMWGGAPQVLERLIKQGVDFDPLVAPLLDWLANQGYQSIDHSVAAIAAHVATSINTKYKDTELPDQVKRSLVKIRSLMLDGPDYYQEYNLEKIEKIDDIIGDGIWKFLPPGDDFSDRIAEQILQMEENERRRWITLLQHCGAAKSAKPNKKWSSLADQIVADLPSDKVQESLLEWISLASKGKSGPVFVSNGVQKIQRQKLHDMNNTLVRGLIWLSIRYPSEDLCRVLRRLAIVAYGDSDNVRVGNACLYALGEIGTIEAVGQLAILKVRVKHGSAKKGIEKAFVATAEKVGIAREELEEMSVPTYGLTEVGVRKELLGDMTAVVSIDGNKSVLQWLKPDGKIQKSVPAAIKKEFAEQLKEIKQTMKDIDKMIAPQSVRIEQTYLRKKAWSFAVWKERYLDHLLVGSLARRIIWRFSKGGKTEAAILNEGEFVNNRGEQLDFLDEQTEVALWHPLDGESDDVLAWRDFLLKREIRQPFKQAHREVYILTDAEQNTEVYSNRFAGHVLKQHQFNALCGGRNWKNSLRLMVDDSYPPAYLNLPEWKLRAEYWVEGAGTEYGIDTNDIGTFHYLLSDQVRFYRLDAATNRAHASLSGYGSSGLTDNEINQPRPLTEIPAVVFSEVMRDVDLFVGVSSVGNDPTWSDGGPQGRYMDYWQSYSFGELGATAEIRRDVLKTLVPRLKIGNRCSFLDRFLVVRGDIRTYKIHLGSGNILMEPNDQYLCIVASQSVSKGADRVFLPFEGDNMLSIILSKAFLLAEDKKINDKTILSQIGEPLSMPGG